MTMPVLKRRVFSSQPHRRMPRGLARRVLLRVADPLSFWPKSFESIFGKPRAGLRPPILPSIYLVPGAGIPFCNRFAETQIGTLEVSGHLRVQQRKTAIINLDLA